MKRYLIDADAFLHLRKLGLLDLYFAGPGVLPVILAGRVAEYELSSIAQFVTGLRAAGRVEVEHVRAASEAMQRFKALRQQGADRGEAEAIAWAMGLPVAERPLFISVDRKARQFADQNGVPAADLMDLMVDWVERGLVRREDVEQALLPWEDKTRQLGRPADYTTFDETYRRRLEHRRSG